MPRVSIVIPTFNRRAMLGEAVVSALAQRYPDLEVLVSDNCSTDGTAEAMQAHLGDPRFRYVRNEANLGMVGNWRRAVFEYARGDWFLILSDDDLLLDPDYLTKAMALVEERPDLVLVYAGGWVLYEASGRRRALRPPFGRVERGATVFASRDRVKPMDFTLCNVLFRRSLAIERDAFADPLNLCCDSQLFLELCLLGDVGVIPELVSLYRIHGANLILRPHPDVPTHLANLSHYLKPRRLALARGALTPRQRRRFDRKARKAVRRTILLVARRQPWLLRGLLRALWDAERELTRRTLLDPVLYLKALLHRAARLVGR